MVKNLRARVTPNHSNLPISKRVPARNLAPGYIAAQRNANRKKASIRQAIDGGEAVGRIARSRLRMQRALNLFRPASTSSRGDGSWLSTAPSFGGFVHSLWRC